MRLLNNKTPRNTTRIKIFFILLITICVVSSCDNTVNSVITVNNNYVEAQIVWTGPLEVDGCEWIIFLADRDGWCKASNLPKEYEVDSIKIKIKYEIDNDFIYYCGDNPEPQKAIKIIEFYKK